MTIQAIKLATKRVVEKFPIQISPGKKLHLNATITVSAEEEETLSRGALGFSFQRRSSNLLMRYAFLLLVPEGTG